MSIKEKGFSLPEITIALGLLGGISLVTIKVMENQTNNEATLKAKAEIQKTTALLKSVLNDPVSCKKMLEGQPLSAAINGETSAVLPPVLPPPAVNPTKAGLYQNIKDQSYREILAVGSNYGRFRIAPAALNPIKFIKVTDTGTNVDAVDLSIQYNVETKSIIFRDDGNYANDKTYIEKIPLLVTFDTTTNRITDCGLVVSDAALAAKQKLCDSMGNMTTWNTTTNRCEFNPSECTGNTIPERQARSNLDTDAVFNCVDIHTQFNVMQLFDTIDGGLTRRCTSATGTYSIIAQADADDGGRVKLRIQCSP